MTMTYDLKIYNAPLRVVHIFDPYASGEVGDGFSLCKAEMTWGDRMLTTALEAKGLPPCPDCQAAYAAHKLRALDGAFECFFCDGQGVTTGGPRGDDQERQCPVCHGSGRTDAAGIGG